MPPVGHFRLSATVMKLHVGSGTLVVLAAHVSLEGLMIALSSNPVTWDALMLSASATVKGWL
jgi:hypothetical protein